jgi:ABC-2 type transport system permease protein
MTVAFFSAFVYLAAGFIAGMDFKSGALGVPTIILLGVLIALGFAGIGAYIGLRSGSGEAVQGFFPLLFVLLFLSSVNLPRNLIEQDWFRTIATYNPVSYLFEGLRSLVITGWDGEALALGFGIATAIAILGVFGASSALRTRLVRT